MKKHLLFFFFACVLFLSGPTALAQIPTYSCKISGAAQVSCNMFEFDVTIQRTGTTVLQLAMIQVGININPAIIPAGAQVNVSMVPGSSALNTNMKPTPDRFNYDASKNCIIMTAMSPAYANRTTISNAPVGTKVGRFRVACSQAFLPGATIPAWSWAMISGYQTKVFAYIGTINTDITSSANHYLIAPYSTTLTNSSAVVPAASTISTDMTVVCASPGNGATITVDNTTNYCSYYLYKDGIQISGVGAVAYGNGGPVSFGALQTNGTYTVKSPSCSGNVDMVNSVTITAMQPVVASVTMSCVNSGSNATFTAHPVNAGPAPWFTWYVNGVDQLVYNPTFTYAPQIGDSVYCCLFPDGSTCLTPFGQCIPSNIWTNEVFFHENFDPPSNADSVIASGAVNNFSINTRLHFSGTQCDSAVVSPNDTAYLTTISFNTLGFANVKLSFSHICKIEIMDAGKVQVSVNMGPWVNLTASEYINPGNSQFAASGNKFNASTYPLDWDPANSIAKPGQSWWKNETFNISALAGNQLNVRVRFALMDGNGNGAFFNHGWYIDNILINSDSTGSSCTQSAIITPAGPFSACIGNSVLLTCNAIPGASYYWTQNGSAIPYNNTYTYYADSSGTYNVTIVVNSCIYTSNFVTVSMSNYPPVPVITQTGSFNNCGGGSVTLSAPAGASTYYWSNGDTTQSIVVTSSGSYVVGVGNSSGCVTQSSTYVVTATPMTSPEICMVSIDNASGHNIVIWNKPLTSVIDHFNVYGEGYQTNIFNLIGSVNYSSMSEFIDTASNPLQQAYRYEISAVDTCGTETAHSPYHKTIHLAINQGMGNTINLLWNHYEGFAFLTYNIYRGTNASNMTLLTTLANINNSYTDLTPPSGFVYYQIEALNPNPCAPSKTTYSGSRSNIATNDPTFYMGMQTDELNNSFVIYPNPANDILNITGYTNNTLAEVYDINGKLLLSQSLNNPQLDISPLAKGLYFIKLSAEGNSVMRKFVKE